MKQESISGPQSVVTHRPGLFSGQRKLYIAIAMLAIALVYLTYAAFQGASVFYLTVGELLSGRVEPGKTVRVNGKLAPNSFQREPQGTVARFSLTDGKQTLPAIYDGVFPELFFNEHSDIVLEGYYGEDGAFHATTTPIVKCPTKYQAVVQAGTSKGGAR